MSTTKLQAPPRVNFSKYDGVSPMFAFREGWSPKTVRNINFQNEVNYGSSHNSIRYF
jgi:hypothetical protein